MTHSPRTSPRAEYLRQENERVQASVSLAEKFPHVKTITVDLAYYDPEGISCSSQIKYTLNLQHAKSLFRVACHNHECVRGDFDLSDALLRAILGRQTNVSGEACCGGWRSRATIDTVTCRNMLRYKLTIGY